MFNSVNLVFKRVKNISFQTRLKTVAKVDIFINDNKVSVPSYYTVMQALKVHRVTIPSFCYHDRLSIAGNCRMCLVQIVPGWKPQIACALPVFNGMKIHTNSLMTQNAQEAVLEFLLADHPLDCPICEQGGECDLQDLTVKFGNDRSRFTESHFTGKRAVESKYIGPLIETEMNRCIHCTRCIRFGSQICGVDVLGTTGRGHDMLVGTYVDKMFLSELSGNIIDLCPVGSLTSRPYKVKARAWELKKYNSIDVMDATGTNIVVNTWLGRTVRVLPREHEEINQEWLSDKGRWAIDSLEVQRLVTPMVRIKGCLEAKEWKEALKAAACLIVDAGKDVAAVAGPYTNVETLVACKDFLNALGSEHTYIEPVIKHSLTSSDFRCAYALNMRMSEFEKADNIILIGTNPRFEAPILNVWIRQAYRNNEADIHVIGPVCDYNYHVNYLGETSSAIGSIVGVIEQSKHPLVFVGIKVLSDPNSGILLKKLFACLDHIKVPNKWEVLHFVPLEASFAGALEVGWKPNAVEHLCECNPKVVISLGCDNIIKDWHPQDNCKLIYIGFQGDVFAQKSEIVLPGMAYTEGGGTFMNMECRAQFAWPAAQAPGKARPDWKIIRALSEFCDVKLKYSNRDGINCRMEEISPSLVHLDECQERLFFSKLKCLLKKVSSGKCEGNACLDVDLKTLEDYFCTDVYTCNSATMRKAMKAVQEYNSCPYAKN